MQNKVLDMIGINIYYNKKYLDIIKNKYLDIIIKIIISIITSHHVVCTNLH